MVNNTEKRYVFKLLFEDNITQVSSIGGKAHLCTLSDVRDFPQHIYWNSLNFLSDAILQFLYSVRSVSLCDPIQYCLACRNLSVPPDVKMLSKHTLHYSSGIIVFKKRFHGKRSMLFRRTLRDD